MPDLSHNEIESRYEAYIDGELAGVAEYEPHDQMVVFTHTEVAPACEGRGVGSALARFALDDARRGGRQVLPLCPFIKGWIGKHPEYGDLVAEAVSTTD